jgi:hypothetical protein
MSGMCNVLPGRQHTLASPLLIDSVRAIVQAVSRRFLTEVAWIQSQVRSYGICDGQSRITGAGFLGVLQFLFASCHSTKCSILICHLGLVQVDRLAKWTHSHPIPLQELRIRGFLWPVLLLFKLSQRHLNRNSKSYQISARDTFEDNFKIVLIAVGYKSFRQVNRLQHCL